VPLSGFSFDQDINDSLGHVWRSRSSVRVHGRKREMLKKLSDRPRVRAI